MYGAHSVNVEHNMRMPLDSYRFIGQRTKRQDAPERLTGQTRFVSDLALPNALHARFVPSPFAAARIVSIDTSEARAVPGVLINVPAEQGPYGAKGVGEPPVIPGAAALANAVYQAVGARVRELPMTSERVLAALLVARNESNNGTDRSSETRAMAEARA
jgi:CO/xanthine dehydrogenase Mo-binding subunit